MFALDNVNVPAPLFTSEVVPEITPDCVPFPVASRVSAPPSKLTFRSVLIAPAAVRVKPSAPTVEVTFAPVLNVMLFDALRVSVAAAPAVLAIAFATVISPAWRLLPLVVVVTFTLVPAFSAVFILPVVTIALSLVLLKFGLAETLVSDPAV